MRTLLAGFCFTLGILLCFMANEDRLSETTGLWETFLHLILAVINFRSAFFTIVEAIKND